MKTKHLLIFVGVIILSFSACTARVNNSETLVSTPIQTAAMGFTRTLTPTSSPPTPMFSATPTHFLDDSLEISTRCVDIKTDVNLLQEGNNGLLVIAQDYRTSLLYNKLRVPFLYDPLANKKIELPGAYNFAVSLDQSRLAYLSRDDKLMIVDRDLKLIEQMEIGNYRIFEWGQDGLFVTRSDEYSFLNFTTREIQYLNQEFPNMYPTELWKSWYPIAIYDPTLTRVIYPTLVKSISSIALWDVQNQKELAGGFAGHVMSILPEMTPTWTSDGQNVILAVVQKDRISKRNERKLIKIDRNGVIQTLMNIPKDIGTLRFAIAPNETSIAFWSPDPTSAILENLMLYVLDTKQNKLTNYCLVSKFLTIAPVWSGNSKQLAVELLQDEDNSDVVVLDLEREIAIKIAEDAQPVGWLK